MLSDRYQWPQALLLAQTISSFHQNSDQNSPASTRWWWDPKVLFFVAAAVAFIYESSVQLWLYWVTYLPVLCWMCTSRSCGVLGSGPSGTNIAGFGLDFPGSFSFLPNILPTDVLIQMFLGCAVLTWMYGPLYLSGVVAWPGAFGVFDDKGNQWTPGQRIFLSGGTWSMMAMLFLL